MPRGWETLKSRPSPFAALYRLDCCGQRNLLLTVRGDGERLAVAVSAPPAGVILEAFMTAGEGWTTQNGGRCVGRLQPGILPLRDGSELPLTPDLAATLLSGNVPGETRALGGSPGWVGIPQEGLEVSWRIAESPMRCVELQVRRRGLSEPVLQARLGDHHARIPGRVEVQAGNERAVLRLVEWKRGDALAVPPWTGGPACGGRP